VTGAVQTVPAGIDGMIAEADRVLVVGGPAAAVAAARTVGMSGRVVAVCAGEPERLATDDAGRRLGLYQLEAVLAAGPSLPADDASLDAVVLAAPAGLGRPRGAFLGEVRRVLRRGGRLLVLGAAA
jgi:ubiquinone/menaquinone biosynthesis C-methylase UbiE